MKKLILLFLLVLCIDGLSQCPSEDLEFNTQSEIDQFLIDYPNCTEIESITIMASNLNNLDGLQNITQVNGMVYIKLCPHLTDVSGLSNLEYVGDYLYLEQIGIDTIDHIFNKLQYAGSIFFHNMYNLSYIDDFHNLQIIENSFIFDNIPNITYVNGFENISHLNENFQIVNCSSLLRIEAFDNLTNIGGTLYISANNLSEMVNFSNLESIGGSLNLYYTSLSNLNWLSNLNSIGGPNFILAANDLNLLDAIENVDLINIDYLGFYGNSSLSECSKPNICQYLSNGGISDVYNNLEGCNSVDEILNNCNMSTSDKILNDKVAIFPNPAKDKLQIQSNNLIIQEIGLYSVEGRLLQKYNPKERMLDVSKYTSGNYVLVVETDKGKVSKKILITN